MQKVLSSTIQVAAALIPIAGWFLGLPTLAEGKEIYSDKDGKVFVDTDSIEVQASVRNFTTSKVYSKPKQFPGIKDKVYKLKNEQAVDCKAKNLRSISTTFYDRNNKNLKNNPGDKKFKPVPKGGNDEKVVNFVCKYNQNPKPIPSPKPTISPSPKPFPAPEAANRREWKSKTQKFIKEFNLLANKVQDPIVKKRLLEKANSKARQQELIQIGQATCAFVKSGKFMDELNNRREIYISNRNDPEEQALLRSQYYIVNKASAKYFCPEVAHLMNL